MKPTYEQLINFMLKVDHQLANRDELRYTDPLAHELEELLEAAGVHYEVMPPPEKPSSLHRALTDLLRTRGLTAAPSSAKLPDIDPDTL